MFTRLSTIKELLTFFWKNKLWWMMPFVIVLIVVGVLLLIGASSPLLPFLYTAI